MNLLQELLRGRSAHADPLACVADLTVKQAGRRVSGLQHTIWQLVSHMNFWMDIELRCTEDPETPVPKDWSVSWPVTDGPVDEDAWRREVERFRGHLDQLVAVAGATAAILSRIAYAGTEYTVEHGLWTVVAHNSYHTGQIVQLRQAIGAWPPGGEAGT